VVVEQEDLHPALQMQNQDQIQFLVQSLLQGVVEEVIIMFQEQIHLPFLLVDQEAEQVETVLLDNQEQVEQEIHHPLVHHKEIQVEMLLYLQNLVLVEVVELLLLE
tara:strand:- start:376 stop:693 length:318 start_codon:yes stop_codon:yes gene_type:complete